MAGGWLDITDASGTRREPLGRGWLRIGGAAGDVPFPDTGHDELHVSGRPPRARFQGSGEAPLRNGSSFREVALRPGDRIDWAGRTLVYGGDVAQGEEAALEELPLAAAAQEAGREQAASPRGHAVWRRLAAGLALDLGAADEKVARRWRDAVVKGEFEPDACAEEILAGGGVDESDPRLAERSGRLLRDFLMAPVLTGVRGTGRRLRQATRGGAAFVIAQGLALLILALILIAMLLVYRLKGGSADVWLDRLLLR